MNLLALNRIVFVLLGILIFSATIHEAWRGYCDKGIKLLISLRTDSFLVTTALLFWPKERQDNPFNNYTKIRHILSSRDQIPIYNLDHNPSQTFVINDKT